MKIGLPNALLYYRYAAMWKAFFEQLDCEVVVSDSTNRQVMDRGIGLSVSECCLPVKGYLGHVASLLECCDRIFVPRMEHFDKNEEFCVRFWGLPDIVHSTFPEAPLLIYNLQGQKPGNEMLGFLHLGKALGKSGTETLRAYRSAKKKQFEEDCRAQQMQNSILQESGLKILLVSQPYIIHDPHIGGPLTRMIREQGAVPVFSDRCDRKTCQSLSQKLSSDLYWTMNREAIGAIPFLREQIDGAILITAFPCGTDSLVNELVLRRVRDIPITHIVLDEQQGEAGLQTRIECFLDIIRERRRSHVS